MKKVLITESQLRRMVRKELLNEMDGITPNVDKPSTLDTPLEINFKNYLEKNIALQTLLKRVTTVKQLNGIFMEIVNATNLITDKTQIINSITSAFNEIDMRDGRKDNKVDVRKTTNSPTLGRF